MKDRWDWTGAIALVLAIGLSGGFIAAVIITLNTPGLATTPTLTGLATFGNTLLVLVTGYLGLRIGARHAGKRDDDG